MVRKCLKSIKRSLGALKNAYPVRKAVRPLVNMRRNHKHAQYLRTSDCYYLKTLRGIHAGERCFILGNGPSLNAADCEKLIGEYTFASNRIYAMFKETAWRPTYYMAIDREFLSERGKELESYELGHMFIGSYCKHKFDKGLNEVTRIYCDRLDFDIDLKAWNDRQAYISEDVSDHICPGHTVTFYAIQMAIYMGFREIYLLGVDNSYSVYLNKDGNVVRNDKVDDYFDRKKYMTSTYSVPASFDYAYGAAREYCDNHGIIIRNATRGGKLEVFERVDFDALFEESSKAE